MVTLVAGWKTVRPEAGWTKPTRERQAKAVPDQGDGALAAWCPDPTQERLEPDAMLIGRPHSPQFDRRVRKGGRDCPYERAGLFLKSPFCSALWEACCGRGACN